MNITFYEYNSFVVEHDGRRIAIDPGAYFLYHFRLNTVIPKTEWPTITHIVVTHGDPDHYWHADRMASASGAPVIMNTTMVKKTAAGMRALGPRSKGLRFVWDVACPALFQSGEVRDVDGVTFTALDITHGPLKIEFGPFTKIGHPGPAERIGWGSMGFLMEWGGRSVVNLGDTVLNSEAWSVLNEPDLLMLPIGGIEADAPGVRNTMDVAEALEAVELIRPKAVIPTHYNMKAFFRTDYGPADTDAFRKGVEKLGGRCLLMGRGETIQIDQF